MKRKHNLIFKELGFRNFLSYGNNWTTMRLDNPGTIFIKGVNLDNLEQSNGVGKTSIQNALVTAVYDRPISDISKTKLVNNINNKDMELFVVFERNGSFYRIERGRKCTKGGNFVKLFKSKSEKFGPKSEISLDSIVNTNKQIEKIIGISYDLFIRISVFAAGHQPFLSMPIGSQTAIMEELVNLTELSEAGVKLKEQIKDKKHSLELLENEINFKAEQITRHDRQVETAKTRIDTWNIEKKEKMKKLAKSLKLINAIDVSEQKELLEAESSVTSELSTKKRDKSSSSQELRRCVAEFDAISAEIVHLKNDECPRCKQKHPGAEAELKLCNEKLPGLQESISTYTDAITEITSELEVLREQSETLSSKISVDDIDELMNIEANRQKIEDRLIETDDSSNPYIEAYEELKQYSVEPVSYDEINELTNTVEHQQFLLKLLIHKNSFIRKALLNQNISFLNTRLAIYLKKLGLPHQVQFNHNLSTSISRFGKSLDYGNLSRGQAARLNFALSLSFMDVLQQRFGGINLCLLDEVLDVGLDSPGVEYASALLRDIARDDNKSIYIISHRGELNSAFDRTITVTFKNGFATIPDADD